MDSCTCKYLYHVTDQAAATGILKNGISPMIGQRSRLAGEEDARIYLTEKSSLPYWKQILGQATILQIDASGLETERMERFDMVNTLNGYTTSRLIQNGSRAQPHRRI